MPNYAIISLGGKQYRVREGERLLVDRLPYAESKTFHPSVLLAGGDGKPELAPKRVEVTAKVVGHVLGKKILIGKHRAKKGYRRVNGFRSRLSQIEIQKIATKQEKKAETAPKAEAEKPKTTRKPAARKTTTKTTKKAETT
jgi:large subunit ribosomal protein L21